MQYILPKKKSEKLILKQLKALFFVRPSRGRGGGGEGSLLSLLVLFKYLLGCLPFSQKIRKLRFEVKWKGNFPENLLGNCGQPPEVVLFFPFGMEFAYALYHLREPSVSRPFLTRSSKICGMECCVVNGKRHAHPVGHEIRKIAYFMQRSFHPDYLAKR